MEKCSPVEMRKNLEMVDIFVQQGMDFAVVPVKNKEHKKEIMELGQQIFEEILEAEE